MRRSRCRLCSTPEGVTDRLATQEGLASHTTTRAQRPKASLIRLRGDIVLSQSEVVVLNAQRRH